MESLEELKKKIVANGRITGAETTVLRQALLEDGVGMTLEKGNFLFDLKNNITLSHASKDFRTLFVEAITGLLLEDETSPGEIDENEAKWLRAKIQAKGYIDRFDKLLLNNLKQKAINFPPVLNYKKKVERRFEHALYFTRYLTLLAVIGALLSAVALFVKGSFIVVEAFQTFIADVDSPHYEEILELFVSSVDVFLFAMVLVIFGVGIYELFIGKIDPVEKKVDGRPSWMQIKSVDDLKSSLGKVILMVLIVTFFKHSIDVEYGSVNDLLKLGAGIVLIALALFITNKSHHHK